MTDALNRPTPAAVEKILGLTPLQKGILFHAMASPASPAYFEQIVCRLDGEVDPERFREALAALSRRHEVLRTAFVTRGQSEPRQVIFAAATVPLRVEDWREQSPAWREAARARLLIAQREQGFRSNRPPLMRMTLVREEASVWTLVWTHHHLILDGWSTSILLDDFFALLSNPTQSRPEPAPFSTYLEWVAAQDPVRDAQTWQRLLSGVAVPTPLGIDRPARAGDESLRMLSFDAYLPSEPLTQFAAAAHVSVGTVLLGALALVLGRLARSDDVVFGLVLSGRQTPIDGIGEMAGLLANSLPLRLSLPAEQTLNAWLNEVQERQHALQSLAHCALPAIRSAAGITSDRPLFECLAAVDNFPLEAALDSVATGFSISGTQAEEHTHLPLTITFVPGAERTRLRLGIDEARIDASSGRHLLDALCHVLNEIGGSAEGATLADIGLRPRRETVPLQSSIPFGHDRAERAVDGLAQRVLAHAAQQGDRIALTDDSRTLTYAELAEHARRIAGGLLDAGLQPEQRVALLLERDAMHVAAMVGVLLAGGCYVPLDTSHPDERLTYLIEDSGARFVLTQPATAARVPAGAAALLLDTLEPVDPASSRQRVFPTPTAEQPAYVIYTSGSTGRPKGVLVSQHNVLRLFDITHEAFAFSARDRWSCTHSFAFDFSVWEIWGALLHGGSTVVVSRDIARDPHALLALLARENVTMLSQTPSSFRLLDQADALAHETLTQPPLALRHLVFGGEALYPRDLAGWIARRGDRAPQLNNMYGITEITVHATLRVMREADIDEDDALIGEPLADLSVQLVDAHGHEVPDGVPGEMLVGGAGVTMGYLGRSELTAERFTGTGSQPVYHSGDLARRRADGELVFVGRADTLLKIRGHRIEPNEVRTAVLSFPGILDAFVAADGQQGDARLVAWFVADGTSEIDLTALRRHLESRLPAHEVPSFLIAAERFSLTANGKLDPHTLPRPGRDVNTAAIAPRTPAEEALAQVWREALQLKEVGVEDDYFALGGDSIRSIQIVGLARERGIDVEIADLFRYRTIAAIAGAKGHARSDADESAAIGAPFSLISEAERSVQRADVEDAYPLARLQAGMVYHSESDDGRRLYHDVFCYHLRVHIDRQQVVPAIASLVAAHPALRTSFDIDQGERPLQRVHIAAQPRVEFEDLAALDPMTREQAFATLPDRMLAEAFDLREPGLLRFVLQDLGDDHWQLGIAFHHAILDGWSVARLLSAFLTRLGGGEIEVPRTPYREFIRLEQAALANPDSTRFWQEALRDMSANTLPRWVQSSLPIGAQRVGKLERTLSAPVFSALQAHARRLKLPLKSLLLAIHVRVLAIAGAQQDILTGMVSNGRPMRSDGAAMLGLFLNTLPMRFSAAASSWADLAAHVTQAEADATPHRRYPMGAMQQAHGGRIHFDTSFNFVDFHVYGMQDSDSGTRGDGAPGHAGFDVLEARGIEAVDIPLATTFGIARHTDTDTATARRGEPLAQGLSIELSYDRAAFGDMQIGWLADLYESAAAHFAADPQGDSRTLPSSAATQTALLQASQGQVTPLSVLSNDVIARYRATLATWPDRCAVHTRETALTFRELDARVQRLAAQLLAQGAGPEKIVAIALDTDDLWRPAALLATLQVGAAYCLLDLAGQPEARVNAMLRAASPYLLISTKSTWARLPDAATQIDQLLSVDALSDRAADTGGAVATQLPDVKVPPTALAYLIFTSGSTGQPKPIAVHRGALANHMAWMQRAFPLRLDDVVLQKTPASFDASIWEFWAPLTVGATLALAPAEAAREIDPLCEAIRTSNATVLQLVPSILDVLLDNPDAVRQLHGLTRVFVGGEALRAATALRFQRLLGATLVNLYGPAEATIDASSAVIDVADAAHPPLGTPVDNAALYVVDDQGALAPSGIAGELWIGGAPVARGYYRQPGETARRFRPDALSGAAGARLYRSGDIARRLPDGRLESLGRRDNQIKLRGWRVEIDEIEHVLASHPAVRRCAIVAHTRADGSTRLTAYVDAAAEAGSHADAQRTTRTTRATPDYRAHLLERLPASLLPGVFEEIETWPTLPNGKTDRKALVQRASSGTPDDALSHERSGSRAPRNDTERLLAEIWQGLLQAPHKIGIDDDFLALGGDSIISLQVSARARQRGISVSPRDVFDHPTIAALARVAVPVTPESAAPIAAAAAGEVPLTPAQSWFFSLQQAVPAHWNQAFLLTLPASLNAQRCERALTRVLELHEAFRLSFAMSGDAVTQNLVAQAAQTGEWFSSVVLPDQSPAEANVAIDIVSHQAQASLVLDRPPLLRAVYMQGGTGTVDGSHRLLLVVHHLIVDGVSWRALLNELGDALADRPLAKPQLGFAGAARAAATRPVSDVERQYWLRTAPSAAHAGRFSSPGAAQPRYGQLRSVSVTLGLDDTTRLLQEVGQRLHASAQELLLSALATSLAASRHTERVGVTMEHHGRGEGRHGMLTHTVGWFTALYPVLLTGLNAATPAARLRTVKAALRAVPANGLGYGLLRHGSAVQRDAALAAVPLPDLCFNYLGQTEGALPMGLGVAEESFGDEAAKENVRGFALEVVALVVDGSLQIRWGYDAPSFDTAQIHAIAEGMRAELLALIESSAVEQAMLPGDFPLARVSETALPLLLSAQPPVSDLWDLTPIQEGMLFHSRASAPTAGLYIEQIVATVESDCDDALLADAWSQVYARHDALRVSFAWRDIDRAVQRVHAPERLQVETHRLSADTDTDADAAWRAFLAADRARGFDLEHPPLMRLTLVHRDERPWRLVWTHHHALFDGWSMAILLAEVGYCYAALRGGSAPPLPAAPSYSRFLAARRRIDRRDDETFWRNTLRPRYQALDLGFAAPRPATQAPQTRTERRHLPGALVESLNLLARDARVTPNTVIEGAYALLLSRLARQRDVSFGVVFSGRDAATPGIEQMVGVLINTLPVCVNCAPGQSVPAFLRGLFDHQSQVAAHQYSSLTDIQRWSGAGALQPLFETVFVYENYPVDARAGTEKDGLRIGAIEVEESSNFPLTLYAKPDPDGLILDAVHDEARLPGTRMAAVMDALVTLLHAMAGAPTARIGDLPLLPLAAVNGPADLSTPPDDTLLALFERARRQAPDSQIVGPDRTLTRTQLFDEARVLAMRLRAVGVQERAVVAVCVPRGVDLLVALLATLSLNATYLPIDPGWPADRRDAMLQDAAPAALVALPDLVLSDAFSGETPSSSPGSKPLIRLSPGGSEDGQVPAALAAGIDPAFVPAPHPEDIAYTIFTSGSTGRPKGVQIRHRSLVNLLTSFQEHHALTASDVLLSVTTISFDIAALELFQPLLSDAQLVIVSAQVAANGIALMKALEAHHVTVMQATPTSWRLLLAAGWQPAPGFRAWCGGEALPLDLAEALLARGVTLLNVYGPTETTIWSAAEPVRIAADAGRFNTPVRSTQLYVVDQDAHALPAGVVGELMIGGVGLARGYLNDPGRTARSFRPDPFSTTPGARLYATGDLAVLHPDRAIALRGRADGQVKVNGYRIELDDIEYHLRTLPNVADAAASVRRGLDGRAWGIEGHLVLADPALPFDDNIVRQHLARRLPSYMLPQVFDLRTSLPRTGNGKLDRRTLQRAAGQGPVKARRAPSGVLEEAVCALWQDVFAQDEIDVDGDFFELGGDSLLLTQIHARVIQIFGVEPPLGEMLDSRTPADMAALIERHATRSPDRVLKVAKAYLTLRGMSEEEREALRRSREARLAAQADGTPPASPSLESETHHAD